METSNYLFRSQFDNALIFALSLGGVLLLFFMLLGASIWLFIMVLFVYLIFAIFQRRYYFYEHQIVRIFIFRPFCRKKIFRYENIKIKYINGNHKNGQPQFVIFSKQYRIRLKNLVNTFYFHKHIERVKIVEFLLSKNVPIEVRTDFEKRDKEIIDMVKRKSLEP